MRMRAAKNAKKKKKNIILRIAFAAFAVYVVVQIVSLQIQLRNKKQEIEQLNADIQKQELSDHPLTGNASSFPIHCSHGSFFTPSNSSSKLRAVKLPSKSCTRSA